MVYFLFDDLKNYVTDHLLHKSGNKIVDDFIRHTQYFQGVGMKEFVPYDQFKDIKFIDKLESYEATQIDSEIKSWNKGMMNLERGGSRKVILKKLNSSESITSQKLNRYIF